MVQYKVGPGLQGAQFPISKHSRESRCNADIAVFEELNIVLSSLAYQARSGRLPLDWVFPLLALEPRFHEARADLISLRDEMQNWEAMMTTHFKHTLKYDQIAQVALTLGEAVEAISLFDTALFTEETPTDLLAFADRLEHYAQTVSDACSEVDMYEYPTAQ